MAQFHLSTKELTDQLAEHVKNSNQVEDLIMLYTARVERAKEDLASLEVDLQQLKLHAYILTGSIREINEILDSRK